MCLIAWNWQPETETPLLLLSNRDEFYARRTRALHWWDDGQVLAGKDLQAGGTWLGVSRCGHLAALTNYRLPIYDPRVKPSRGALVADFLQGSQDGPGYLTSLAERASDYNPFNLIVFDGLQLMGFESRNKRVVTFTPGIGAVSNADFDTPWPKLTRLKTGLKAQHQAGHITVSDLLPLLHDQSLVADSALPRTGVDPELERQLSATFIKSEHYGTRACSVVALKRKKAMFFEESHSVRGMLASAQQFFTL
jgi:uncharacterized protein with NRDE domain